MAARRTIPVRKLISESRRLWDRYCARPTKTNLRTYIRHHDMMKERQSSQPSIMLGKELAAVAGVLREAMSERGMIKTPRARRKVAKRPRGRKRRNPGEGGVYDRLGVHPDMGIPREPPPDATLDELVEQYITEQGQWDPHAREDAEDWIRRETEEYVEAGWSRDEAVERAKRDLVHPEYGYIFDDPRGYLWDIRTSPPRAGSRHWTASATAQKAVPFSFEGELAGELVATSHEAIRLEGRSEREVLRKILSEVEAAEEPETRRVRPGLMYHVTWSKNLPGIAKKGLVPGSKSVMGDAPWMAEHRRGAIFLTGPEGLRFWYNDAEDYAWRSCTDPLAEGCIPVVLKVEADPDACETDELGQAESGAPAYKCTITVDPRSIRVWTGTKWAAMGQHEDVRLDFAYTERRGWIRPNRLIPEDI